MKKICCLVTLYNPELENIKQYMHYIENFDIVLFFDNSSEKSVLYEELIKYKNVVYVWDGNNYGYAHSINYAFDFALRNEMDYLLTMDQDTVFEEGEIQKSITYVNAFDKNDIGIIATNFNKMYHNKGKIVYSKCYYHKNTSEAVFAITSGNYINVSNVKKIFPLENYFIAYVDYELNMQLYINNLKVYVMEDVVIHQQIGQKDVKFSFLSTLGFTNHAPIRYYYLGRNSLHFIKKYRMYKVAKKLYRRNMRNYFFKILLSEKNKIQKIKNFFKGRKDSNF